MAVSRNAESRFAVNPTNLDISRSRFDRTSTVKTSFNVGELIPFYVDEVLPGDTFDVSCAKIVRMQPMVTPPMDDLFLDTYFFFVPNRLVYLAKSLADFDSYRIKAAEWEEEILLD